jgi:hypothetical protein
MFALDQVIPWGRSFEEYRRMFALTDADLRLRILACADGPASFNAQATRRATAVISIDPLYQLDSATIAERIAVTRDQMLEQAQRNSQQFVWDSIQSVEELGRIRMHAMQVFLDDYDLGKVELCRVAREVRIFPLLALDGRTSPYVPNVVAGLSDARVVTLETVPYEFQQGGTR